MNCSCFNLQYNKELSDIVSRLGILENKTKYMPHIYLGFHQLDDKLGSYTETKNTMKLNLLALSLENLKLRNKIDTYKRFQLLLANKDVSRVKSVMNSCLKSGAGLSKILNKFSMAAENLYRPRDWDDAEIDLAVLVLRIGALLYCIRFIRRLSYHPRLSYIR